MHGICGEDSCWDSYLKSFHRSRPQYALQCIGYIINQLCWWTHHFKFPSIPSAFHHCKCLGPFTTYILDVHQLEPKLYSPQWIAPPGNWLDMRALDGQSVGMKWQCFNEMMDSRRQWSWQWMDLINVTDGCWITAEIVLGINEFQYCFQWKLEFHEFQNRNVIIGEQSLFNWLWNDRVHSTSTKFSSVGGSATGSLLGHLS